MKHKLPKLFVLLSSLFLVTGCSLLDDITGGGGGESGETSKDATAIDIGSDFELTVEETKQLTATFSPSDGKHESVTWSSSNSNVASVNFYGVVTAVSAGKATISATAGSLSTSVEVTVKGKSVDPDKAAWTIMIYMCGSDLESDNGLATEDINEIKSVQNQPDDVNIIIQTGGATKWKTSSISASKSQRWHIANKSLVKDSETSKVNMGLQSSFESFLTWGLTSYPAEKTGVILWNHGGAMGGVCFDDNFNDTLLASEVKGALKNVFSAQGITNKLEFVGYDACLMAVQDIAEFNSTYFNYMVAAQESEAGEGWDYDHWVDDLYAKKATKVILSEICDTFISEYDSIYGGQYANDQTLSALDLSYMAEYKTAFEDFASSAASLFKNNKTKLKNLLVDLESGVKSYGATYFYEEEYDDYAQYYPNDEIAGPFVDGGDVYYYINGCYDFGTFDVYDFVTKVSSNSTFSSLASKAQAVKTALSKVVFHNSIGNEAGESHGLCLYMPMDSYAEYKSTETNFTNWRNAVGSLFH
ncbi:MAG: Ig-like domain-containing protein [Bacilli bacterium]|nr:Ig-like domain-containing protein [Bacilli bacterium]